MILLILRNTKIRRNKNYIDFLIVSTMDVWQIIFSKDSHQIPFYMLFLWCDHNITPIKWQNYVLSPWMWTDILWLPWPTECGGSDTMRLPKLVYKNGIYFCLCLLGYLLLEPSCHTARSSCHMRRPHVGVPADVRWAPGQQPA